MNEETKQFADGMTASGATLEQLIQKSGTTRPSKTIPWPGWRGKLKEDGGLDWTVTIWELGFDELAAAQANALEFLSMKFKVDRYDVKALFPEVLDLETKVQTLHEALRVPASPTVRFAKSANTIRILPVDEIQALYEACMEWTMSRSPFITLKSVAELEEVLSYVGKGLVSETLFQRYDAVSLRSISTELARRLARLQAANSLGTSSPSGPTG